MKGKVYVFTGDGKGKTTAALGMAVQAAGDGRRVFIGQFIKGDIYSETLALKRFSDLIAIEQLGIGLINRNPSLKDIETAQKGLERVKDVIHSHQYDMVILDEANIALKYGLLSVEDLIQLIDDKPKNIDLVITGRYAPHRLLEKADTAIEMKSLKHYYQQGVASRKGIEK